MPARRDVCNARSRALRAATCRNGGRGAQEPPGLPVRDGHDGRPWNRLQVGATVSGHARVLQEVDEEGAGRGCCTR